MAENNNDLNHPILNLTAQEKTAYSYLFSLADTDSLGVVTGERAVSFFEKTHVPAPVLGEIWQIADTENRGLLTKPGFCMVVRLIGWYQNGQPHPTAELAFKPAPIPNFDGIKIPGVPQPATSPTAGSFPQGALQPQLSGQSTGGGPIRVPPLDPAKVQQYSGLFERSGAQNGLLDGGTAKSIFERAGLSNDVLGKIWMLSDRDQRGALDQTEFIVAMHLLTSMKTRAMTALPYTLPPGLYEAAARRGQRPTSRQLSGAGAPGAVPRQYTGSGTSTQPRTQSPLARAASSSYSIPPVQSAQTTGQQWLVTPQEKAQYDRYFATIDTSGKGIISGDQAVQFFSDSRLPEDTLASIWDLADINSEGQLNRDEFAVAMYLIGQQRAPNPPPVPAFLPAALIPPSMRGNQQVQQPPAPAAPVPKSASDDLFGLDSSPTQAQPSLQPQGTGASVSRDPFGGSQPGSTPGSPARFQSPHQPPAGTMFKQFVPTSAFGASLAQQHTGASTSSSQGQARDLSQMGPKASMPSAMDDLLGDNDAHAEESSKFTNETTELANMSNQIGNLRTQMEATQNKKTATQADINATSSQKRDLEQRLQQFRAQYEAEVKTVKEMEQQLAASRESTKKLSQEVAMLEGTRQDLQNQHNAVIQQLQADQQENASLKQKISEINAEVARLKPEVEKMKLEARQQKGLVSINKKQLATNEAERDRLQNEKSGVEGEAAEQARSAAASPDSAVMSPASNVASPAPSTMSSTNPFFRKTSADGAASPPAIGPTPSAFDTLFGPSAAFAPTGQTSSRSGTPPATSFIGRSMPDGGTAIAAGVGAAVVGAAAVGGMAVADSVSSADKPTPSATPPLSAQAKESPLDRGFPAEPPPPPVSRQFTATHLPIGGGVIGAENRADSDTASSTKVIPPTSRAGGIETPREMASSPVPILGSAGGPSSAFLPPEPSKLGEPEREIVPGAFPHDEAQPSTSTREISSSNGPSTQTGSLAPKAQAPDDFESAFASFGEGEKAKETDPSEDPFAPSSSRAVGSQPKQADSEFPPIQSLEHDDDDDSDSDDEGERAFDDNFTTASPQRNGVPGTSAEPIASGVASGDEMAADRPDGTFIGSTTSDLPGVSEDMSPPTYEESDDAAHGAIGEPTASNQFPPQFGTLLPARDDPTSHPPPLQQLSTVPPTEDEATPTSPPSLRTSLGPASAAMQSTMTPTTDVFVDASSRPVSSFTEPGSMLSLTPTAAAPAASRNVFDDFDDFGDLSEAKEADKSGSDFDFFGRQSQDEFNPAFDSPAPSQTATPMARSVQVSQESNGFTNFAPNTSAFASTGSTQETPSNSQHDWDAIFSGLDSSGKDIDTSFGNSNDPWGAAPAAATTNGNGTVKENTPTMVSAPLAKKGELGRAITPGTDHDDPILKRLTGMGYPRADALNALEMYDYDINKAVDHLTGS